MVRVFWRREAPLAGVKSKVADWISRVLEYPVTNTVRVLPEALNDRLVMVGATLGTTIVMGAMLVGVTLTPLAVSWSVTVMVPATVPTCTITAGVAVVLAGSVKLKVVPPVANCT